MNAPSPPSRWPRSIGAVVAGLLAVIVASIAADIVMHSVGALPATGQAMGHGHAALALAYRVVIGVLGGYVTARLAPHRPVAHAIVLGGIGTAISMIGVAATWSAGPEFGPKWYPVVLAATALPCAWAGGRIYSPPVARSTRNAD
jgi:hypothetical protein